MALINTLNDIGNAIREKTGGTELIPLKEMASVIKGISGGGTEHTAFEHGTYIESNGTQYIDLGVKAKSGLKIIFDVGLDNIGVQQTLFGASETGSKNRVQTYFHTTSDFYYYYNKDNFKYYTFSNKSRCICYEISDNKLFESGVTKITNPQAEFVSTLNMYLFALNDAGTASQFSNLQLYRFTVIDNEEVVLDLIPAISNEVGHENEVCLWDRVSSSYLYNKGNGAFTLGSDYGV